jgi:hypothetical protein
VNAFLKELLCLCTDIRVYHLGVSLSIAIIVVVVNSDIVPGVKFADTIPVLVCGVSSTSLAIKDLMKVVWSVANYFLDMLDTHSSVLGLTPLYMLCSWS